MNEVGHNNPPDNLTTADGLIKEVSSFMAGNPVVQTDDEARQFKLYVDRTKAQIKDLEAEQEVKSYPLRVHLETIRSDYRPKRRMLGDLLDEMLGRVELFVQAEQRRREQAAALLVAHALEARRKAEEAERIEREKLDNASQGEVGINVAEVIDDADEAFEAYEKAERKAEVARRDMRVKIGGGFSRAIGMRKTETLHIEDGMAAIGEMGMTPDIRLAILKSAGTFRKLNNRLPNGIVSKVEEHL